MTNPEEQPKVIARLFRNGRSQAVRLPKAMELDSAEVWIWKEGDRVILEPVARKGWPEGYWERFEELASELGDIEVEPMAPAFLDLNLDE